MNLVHLFTIFLHCIGGQAYVQVQFWQILAKKKAGNVGKPFEIWLAIFLSDVLLL